MLLLLQGVVGVVVVVVGVVIVVVGVVVVVDGVCDVVVDYAVILLPS